MFDRRRHAAQLFACCCCCCCCCCCRCSGLALAVPLTFSFFFSFRSFLPLLTFRPVITGMTDEISAKNELVLARDWVAYWFTWLYIGSQDVWIVFALYVYAFYGNKKMCAPGDEDKKPEFGDAAYFMMLFTCGVAVGMFYYGTTEPTSYYTGYSGNR